MKLTLQILDAGETFFRPLEDRAITIGASDDADIRLVDERIAPLHARIEPLEGEDGCRLVDLGAAGGTRLNGDDVVQARLAVGDRIEIGCAVLVVGQRVDRPRTADDVLADGLVGRADRRAARARAAESGRRRAIVLGLVGAVVGVLLLAWWSQQAGGYPMRWGDYQRAVREGRLDTASELVAGFRGDWAAGDAERGMVLDEAEARIAAVRSAIAAETERVVEESPRVSRAEQIATLKSRASGPADEPGAIAARVALARIEDLRREGLEDGAAQPELVADGAESLSGAAAGTPDGAGGESVEESGVGRTEPVSQADAAEVSARLREIVAARDAGRFVEALELMEQALSTTPQAAAKPLLDARITLRQTVATEMRRLLDAARDAVSAGTVESVDRALAALREDALRFPFSGEFGKLSDEIESLQGYRERLEEQAAALAQAGSSKSIDYADVSATLTAARDADRNGDYKRAVSLYGTLATSLRDRDPGFAASLDGRRQDLEYVVALQDWLVETAPESLGDGVRDIPPAELATLCKKHRASPSAMVGAGVLAYLHGARDTAEELLVAALRGESQLAEPINGIIARGRGESADGLGYQVVKGAFVSERELRVQERAKELERTLAAMLRAKPEAREEQLEKVLAAGPAELDALVVAMRRKAEQLSDKVHDDPFRKHHEKVAALRTDLDAARTAALDLIFDEVRYFYPYKPPAVSAEKASEYAKVQAEVDELVEAVRDIWEGDGPSKPVPAGLRRTLEDLDWLLEQLAGFAESMPEVEADVQWARSLPTDGEPLSVQSFCWDLRELKDRRHAHGIRAFNRSVEDLMSKAELANVEITNAYREMFGRRPLAVCDKVLEAARSHAEEMATLGYFSHHSPTPGRGSPFDRMKAAGYTMGASENIALHGSAASAHQGWTHSSGHHRNLLAASHREFAVGNSGRYWVQNFGRGESYRNADSYINATR